MLEIKDLTMEFGGIKALSDVSLGVNSGTFVGLMGPNGAGKTTLINCISRIYRPATGEITFDGQDLLKLPGHKVLELGIARTFQDLNFFSHISNMMVVDYLKLGQFNDRRHSILRDGLALRKSRAEEWEIKKKARRILEFFREVRISLEASEEERGYPYIYGREGFPDLIDVEHRPIGFLSFAWRRRLDLARALVSSPRLLLLDEPAQGLPPTEIEKLGKTLKFIQSEFGVSALIVEHNVATLMDISDQIVMMNFGQKIAEGVPEEIKTNKQVIEIYLGSAFKESTEDDGITDLTTISEQESIARENSKIRPLLEVKNLDVFYGSAQALFSASIKVMPKEITTVLGTNGSGKSTLMRSICGVEKPSFGEILFKGEPMPLGWPEMAVERGIQYVPQGHVVFPELSVLDNIRIGAYFFEKKGMKFKDGLDKVLHFFPMLKDLLQMQAASLSGGQQQMLAIAQAIIGKPDLLLLDEPSLGLSPLLVDKLFEIIKNISTEEGCAIILIEQDVKRALDVSDYVFMMSSGVVIAEGASARLKQNESLVKKYLGFR